MCWITYRPSHAKPLIAEEDIPVQKVLDRQGPTNYTSPYFSHFVWTFNHLHECPIGHLYDCGIFDQCWVIHQGLHSCKEIECGTRDFVEKTSKVIVSSNYVPNRVIVNCIIPKGATYYVNEFNEYVSNQLKLVS